jgi:hypothetical protein
MNSLIATGVIALLLVLIEQLVGSDEPDLSQEYGPTSVTEAPQDRSGWMERALLAVWPSSAVR